MDVNCRRVREVRLADGAATIAAMPSLPKFKLLGALVAAIALLALPAAAEATLVYVKNPMHPAVFAANDNGGGGVQGRAGDATRGSRPTATSIAYQHEGSGGKRELKLAAADGGGSTTVLGNLQDSFYVTFSPDSKMIAALRGPEIGKRKLVLIDVTSGTLLRTVASGYFSGISFSPDGTELVYSEAESENFPPHRPTSSPPPSRAGKPVQITKGDNSLDPLWGPTGKIVFVKQLGAKKRKYGPKNELYLMNPNGTQAEAPDPHQGRPAAAGPLPDRLVGQRQPAAGRVRGPGHQLRGHRQPEDRRPEAARQEGQRRAGLRRHRPLRRRQHRPRLHRRLRTRSQPPGRDDPLRGGKPKTLVKNAYEPDWSR